MDGPDGWPLYTDRYAALVKEAADMPPIVTTAEIGRPAAEVFAYVTDPTRIKEWQKGVVDGHMDGPADGTPAVGAKCVTTRRIGGASRPSTSELVQIDPPRAWACGHIRPDPGRANPALGHDAGFGLLRSVPASRSRPLHARPEASQQRGPRSAIRRNSV